MSSYDNVIVTDVDGVLLNWGYAFDVWMNEQGYKKVTDEWKHYCVFKQYGILKQKVREWSIYSINL